MRLPIRLMMSCLLLSLLSACEGEHGLVMDCQNTTDAEAICQFTNPEDGERVPDGHTLLISQMGNMEGSLPGNLVFFHTADQSLVPAFPLAEPSVTNSTDWDENGRILAASHTGSKMDQLTCTKNPGKTCGFGYTILRIDPETMVSEKILVHEGGAPMGAATIALQKDDVLYLGSFSGNRMIKVHY